MRMRRKHHMTNRISECDELLLVRSISNLNMKEALETKSIIDFPSVFKNDNKIEVEIGCGKGGFICEKALRNPDINFVAIEKYSNVMVEALEGVRQLNLTNVRFLNIPAECIPCYFLENSVDKIYLNFPTPLPKRGHEKQRLTNVKFLEIYKYILKKGATLELKTDKRDFFDYSIFELKTFNAELIDVDYDLHNNGKDADNIVTEHERYYSSQGSSINKLIAKFIDTTCER